MSFHPTFGWILTLIVIAGFNLSTPQQEAATVAIPYLDAAAFKPPADAVDPDPKQWPLESAAQAIERLLSQLSARLLAGSSAGPEDWFEEGFRGTRLSPSPPLQRVLASGVRAYSGPVAAEPSLGKEAFAQELSSFLAGYVSIQGAHFRVIQISGDAAFLSSRIRYEIWGRLERGGRRQDIGEWATRWSSNGEAWKLLELRCLEFSRQESPGPLFEEITEAAFGGNSSFREQLGRGADFWSRHLDAATRFDFFALEGLAVGDYDGDGWEDVYICQSGGLPNRLYRNLGNGRFEDVTSLTGLGILDSTTAAIWADADNDGDQDIFLIGPEVYLFENRNHRFVRSPAEFEVPAAGRGTFMGAAAADYDRDGDLDLYVCSYVPAGGSAMAGSLHQPTPYHDARNGPPNQLFRNLGQGRFENVTESSGLSVNNDRWSFAAAWSDINADGHPDLYVANDFGRNNLYVNQGNGTFKDGAEEAGVADPGAGMSVAWGDYDRDGRPDLYVSNIWSAAGLRITRLPGFQATAAKEDRSIFQRFSQGNSLYRNQGGGRFEERGAQAGVENGGWAWGSDFLDADGDGWEDLLIVNGYVTNDLPLDLEAYHWRRIVADSPLQSSRSRRYDDAWRKFQQLIREGGYSAQGRERNRFYLNSGDGTFLDITALSGLDFEDDARSFALFDYDRDGDLDVLIKNRTAPQIRLLRNRSARSGSALSFELRTQGTGRDAVGAAIRLEPDKAGLREIRSGSGFLSQSTRRAYFYPASGSDALHAQISWPDGSRQHLQDLPTSGLIRLTQGEADFQLLPWEPGHRSDRAPVSPAPSADPPWEGSWLLERVPLPSLTLRNAVGETVLPAAAGKARLIHLWRPDCPPCRAEVEEWTGLDTPAVEQIWITLDSEPSTLPAGVRASAWAATPESVRLINSTIKHLFARRRDIRIPLTLLVDREGYLVKVYPGPVRAAILQRDLAELETWAERRFNLAVPFAGEFLGRAGSRLEEFFLIGYDLLQGEFYEEAARYFDECLRLHPGTVKAMNNLGLIHLRRGRLEQALNRFQEAARYEPSQVEIQFNIGTALAMKGQLSEAIAVLRRSAELDPGDAEIWNNLGNAYLQSGRAEEAVPALTKALQLDDSLAEAHNNMGILHGRRGNLETALRHFQRAADLRPGFDNAYINMGIVYSAQGSRSQALRMFQKALEANPNNPDAPRLIQQLQAP